jgi:SAM-dependent methyltransferase
MTVTDPTLRFSDRVTAYRAGRPDYPPALVEHLRAVGALPPRATVVDLGVGTGLSAEPFLRAGHAVIGVEPNDAMREGSDEGLAAYPRYRSQAGRAEATGLPGDCAQLVVAGQAFHWFDPAAARAEALRLLVPGGWAALFWNDRERVSPFGAGYEALCRDFGPEFEQVRDRHGDTAAIAVFFGGTAPAPVSIEHERWLDWTQLAALAASASYLPAAGTPQHAAMISSLRALFAAQAQDGRVEMRYTCRLHAAPLRPLRPLR